MTYFEIKITTHNKNEYKVILKGSWADVKTVSQELMSGASKTMFISLKDALDDYNLIVRSDDIEAMEAYEREW